MVYCDTEKKICLAKLWPGSQKVFSHHAYEIVEEERRKWKKINI